MIATYLVGTNAILFNDCLKRVIPSMLITKSTCWTICEILPRTKVSDNWQSILFNEMPQNTCPRISMNLGDECFFEMVDHPTYSLILFWPFIKMKSYLTGIWYINDYAPYILLLMVFAWEWKFLRQWDPNTITPMENGCTLHDDLYWKMNLIWQYSMPMSCLSYEIYTNFI